MAAVSGYGMNYAMNAYGMSMGQMTRSGYSAGMQMGQTGQAGGQMRAGAVKNPGESMQVAPGRKSSPADCETCRNRKYQDGSDEMVSFKSAAHISPEASRSRVMAHEMEHVANAYDKAYEKDGKVLQASVKLETAICPECGRSYVSGGETTTRIQYKNEDNPYMKELKDKHAQALRGMNFDFAV
ncbi:MAG: hypothetical protein K5886_05770 [Lachnospiraceae bacterium]|nr:hypothetical protein [Lachnospiraceae bacterium]